MPIQKSLGRLKRHILVLFIFIIFMFSGILSVEASDLKSKNIHNKKINLLKNKSVLRILKAKNFNKIRENEKININKAVDLALKNNLQLKASYQKIEITRAKLNQIKSIKNFKARIEGKTVLQGPPINMDVVVPLPSQISPVPLSMSFEVMKNFNAKGRLALEQVLTTFGKVENSIIAAAFRVQAEEEKYNYLKSNLVFQVKKIYYGILKSQSSLNVANEYLNLTKEYLGLAEKLHKEGVVSGFDIKRAEVAVAQSQKNVVSAKKALTLTRSTLLLFIDQKTDIPFEVVIPKFVSVADNLELNSLQRDALKNRFELKSLKENINAAKALVKAAQSLNNPDLVLNASYAYQSMQTSFMKHYFWDIGLGIRFPIFDGGEAKAKIQEANASLKSLELSKEALEEKIKLEVKKAYLDVNEATEVVKVTLKEVEKSQEGYRLAKARYNNGVSLAVEMDAALTSYNNSKKNLVNAIYDLNVALALLEKSTQKDIPKKPISLNKDKIKF